MEHPQGPILIDIPKDIQLKDTTFEYLEQPSENNQVNHNDLDKKILYELSSALNSAQKPFVVLGRGALNARQEVWELIERMGLPFGYTLKGKGVLPDDHPQNYGLIGQHGKLATNKAMSESDLVLMIGCNCDDRAFLNPKEFTHGKKAVINPYLANASARLFIDYPVKTDAKYAVSALLTTLKLMEQNKHQERLQGWNTYIKERYNEEHFYNQRGKDLSPVDLMQGIDKCFNPDILVLDIGEHQMHTANHVRLKSHYYKKGGIYGHTHSEQRLAFKKRILTSGTAGTMATSVPYAAGAKIANPDADVLVIMGDGGLEMHVSALWLLARNNLNIPVIVSNNRSYGQVNSWLRDFHEGRIEHAQTSAAGYSQNGGIAIPDFEGAAQMYELPYLLVRGYSHFERKSYNLTSALQELSKCEGPRLMEAIVSNQGAYPMIPSGQTFDKVILKPE